MAARVLASVDDAGEIVLSTNGSANDLMTLLLTVFTMIAKDCNVPQSRAVAFLGHAYRELEE